MSLWISTHGASGQRGQSLVELALSITVIMLLLSGAVSFGMAYFSYVAIRDAAQEGALYGSIRPCARTYCDTTDAVNTAGIVSRVRAASKIPVDLSNVAVVPDAYITVVATTGVACEGSTDVGGTPTPNAVRVTVEYDYPVFMPFVGAIIGSQTIHLTASVTDTILEPACPPPP